jgi:CelD/BcsL family acetyltransferase involved in cellulose biosynthesis
VFTIDVCIYDWFTSSNTKSIHVPIRNQFLPNSCDYLANGSKMNAKSLAASPVGLSYVHKRYAKAAQEPALPVGALVTVITGLRALKELRDEWRLLAEERGNGTSVFQCYNWVSTWCEKFGMGTATSQVVIVAGYDYGQLVFVWPLMKKVAGGLSTIEWLTFPSGQYGDVLLKEGYCPKTWHTAALEALKQTADIDLIYLRHVRNGTSFHHFASENMLSAKGAERAPFMDLSQFKTETDYDQRYTAQQRKRRKKIRKELEALGELEFRKLSTGEETDQAIAQAILEKDKWLGERGRINRIMKCPRHLAFLQSLARSRRSEMEAVVTELRAGGKPISWEIGFRHNGTHFAYITSHCTEHTDLSPGRLHMHLSQLLALKDGMHRFDLMIPHDAHKESWATGTVHTDDYYLPMTWKGRLKGNLYIKSMRPMLRSVYYKLTPTQLKFLKPLTNFVN